MNAAVALTWAAVCGVLSATAFEPLAWPMTMTAAVAAMFWLAGKLRTASLTLVIAVGAVFGLTFGSVLIWWMNAVSTGGYVALVIVQACYFVPVMIGLRAVMKTRLWVLWAPAVWVAGEWARGSFPFGGFPWGRLAHTAIDTPLASFVRLVGMAGTSYLLGLLAALALLAVRHLKRGRIDLLLSGGAALAAGAMAAAAVAMPVGIAGAGPKRQIAIVQGNTPGAFLSWPTGEIGKLHIAETARLRDRINRGESPRPDAVLWPENATDVDPAEDTRLGNRISLLSRQLKAPILIGGIFDGPTSTTALNQGVVWTSGGPQDRYSKRKPVPYGEFVPFRQQLGSLVPRLARDIPRDILAGEDPGGLDISGDRYGDTICYDIAYDGVVRDVLKSGAEILVVQTSNAAFTGTDQPDQQWAISRLRAIETGRWVLVPSTNGISGIIDPSGRSVDRAPREQPATIEHQVQLATAQTPAERVAPFASAATTAAGLAGWTYGFLGLFVARRGRRDATRHADPIAQRAAGKTLTDAVRERS